MDFIELNRTHTLNFQFSKMIQQTVSAKAVELFDGVKQQDGRVLVTDYIPLVAQIKLEQFDKLSEEFIQLPSPIIQNVTLNGTHLDLQLNFTQPELLSKSIFLFVDYLTINLTGLDYLRDMEGYALQEQYFVAKRIEMPFMEQEEAKNEVNQLTSFMSSVLTGSVVLNILMASSMNELWGQMNILQMIIAIPLMEVDMPENSLQLWSGIIEFATFDVLPSADITNFIFGEEAFSPETLEPLNQKFMLLAYDTSNIIYVLGTMFYILAFTAIQLVLALILSCSFWCMPKFCKRMNNYMWTTLVSPSVFIRLFLELNFDLIIASSLQIMAIRHAHTAMDYFCLALSFTGLTLCFVMPVFSVFVIYRVYSTNRLREKRDMFMFGELYEPFLRPETNHLPSLMYNVIYMIRRLFILILVQFAK